MLRRNLRVRIWSPDSCPAAPPESAPSDGESNTFDRLTDSPSSFGWNSEGAAECQTDPPCSSEAPDSAEGDDIFDIPGIPPRSTLDTVDSGEDRALVNCDDDRQHPAAADLETVDVQAEAEGLSASEAPASTPSIHAVLSSTMLAAIEAMFAAHVGPVARFLLTKYAKQAADASVLGTLLVQHIPLPKDRKNSHALWQLS